MPSKRQTGRSHHEPPPLQNGRKAKVVRKRPEPPKKDPSELGFWAYDDPRWDLYRDSGDFT